MKLRTTSDARKKLSAKVRLYHVLGSSRPDGLTDDEIHLMMALYDDAGVKTKVDANWEKRQNSPRRNRANRRAR